jgi:hypothetical protein
MVIKILLINFDFIDMYMSYVPLISYDLGNLAYRTICDVTRGGWETMNCGRGLWGGRETINFILHTRYVSTCGRGLWGVGKQ